MDLKLKQWLWVLVATFALSTHVAYAEEPKYQEGIHYVRLKEPAPIANLGKITVQEFFWYGCPHCFEAEPFVSKWQKNLPKEVVFQRIPGVFNALWHWHGMAYLTAEKLGKLEKMHTQLFQTISGERRPLNKKADMVAFFGRFEVDEATFTKTFYSKEINEKIRAAQLLAFRYELTSVPSMVVQGKYVTDPRMAGGYVELLQVVDYLVGLEKTSLK